MTSEDVDNHFLKEWEAARDILEKFNNRLHDLRKYGFSFITAFLTGSTILFTTYIAEPSNGGSGELFPESIKAVILGVTLLLIGGLYILDRNYKVFQRAANDRANVLERVLNIELSDVITQRYRQDEVYNFVVVLYLFFILGVVLLGLTVLSATLLIWLVIAALATSGFILYFARDDSLMKYDYGKVDWILDKTECKQGDEVRVIMTNLNKTSFPSPDHPISKGEVMWKLVKECDNANLVEKNNRKIVKFGEMEETLSGVTPEDMKKALSGVKPEEKEMKKALILGKKNFLRPYENYTWILPTKEESQNIETGIYCLYRRVFNQKGEMLPEKAMVPLSRKLRIIEKEKAPDIPVKTTIHHLIMKDKDKDEDTQL